MKSGRNLHVPLKIQTLDSYNIVAIYLEKILGAIRKEFLLRCPTNVHQTLSGHYLISTNQKLRVFIFQS